MRRRAGVQGKGCDTWRVVWLFAARVVQCMACDLLVPVGRGCAGSGLGSTPINGDRSSA